MMTRRVLSSKAAKEATKIHSVHKRRPVRPRLTICEDPQPLPLEEVKDVMRAGALSSMETSSENSLYAYEAQVVLDYPSLEMDDGYGRMLASYPRYSQAQRGEVYFNLLGLLQGTGMRGVFANPTDVVEGRSLEERQIEGVPGSYLSPVTRGGDRKPERLGGFGENHFLMLTNVCVWRGPTPSSPGEDSRATFKVMSSLSCLEAVRQLLRIMVEEFLESATRGIAAPSSVPYHQSIDRIKFDLTLEAHGRTRAVEAVPVVDGNSELSEHREPALAVHSFVG